MKKQTFIDVLLEIRELILKQKDIFNIDEIVAYTGYEKSYIYKLTSKKKIPHYKTKGGKSIFFRKTEVDHWLLAVKVKTTDELKIEANEKIRKISI